MKKITVLLLLTLSSFGLGLSVNYKRTNQENHPELRKVTGIGGIFFKCTDPKNPRVVQPASRAQCQSLWIGV